MLPWQLKALGWEGFGAKSMESHKSQQWHHPEGEAKSQTSPPQSTLGENTLGLPGALTAFPPTPEQCQGPLGGL